MRTHNQEILWNRIDKIRSFDKSMVDVYSGIRRVVELEVQGQKTYIQNMKTEVDLIGKLSGELKVRPYFVMVNDSLDTLKEIINRRINRQKSELDLLLEKVFNPLTTLLGRNEEILNGLKSAEKNLEQLFQYGRTVEDSFVKFYRANQTYDSIFEDEQVKQQLKNNNTKLSKSDNSKLLSAYEKIKEEEKLYKFQIETYNRHVPSLMNSNVR